ncbi:hypothetical protein HNO88_002954 [Novosphingobium chloroacetimidivorans]|uniref:Uncharacterized protein n=1 Tax=Novosphingobium chloroacetimidivorans TaxID=1428314 RepID=A0A7W7NXW0_9SPHN|nr:hypothetical protein [Novosphingobium chloroacetimidivorans]MBB4859625.1 hypothetical protein [Novosphingobium chloroacetimidivorans]
MKLSYLASAAATAGAGIIAPSAPGLSGEFLKAAGVTIPMPVLAMGLCFSSAAGFIAMSFSPPEYRMDKWATLFAALLMGLLTAILHPHIPYVKDLPVQAAMMIAGLGSKKGVDRVRDLDFSLPWSKKGT